MNFSKALLITKLKATAVHFSMSLVVFIYLAYLIYYNWYPQPYFSFDGGWAAIRLVAAVDLVLGPFITFLIFDLSKSRRAILFDLIIILVVQLGALAYGIHTTYSQRPVAIVMIDDFVIPATMADYGDTLESASDLHRYSDERPPIILVAFPTSREGVDEVLRIRTEDGVLDHAQTGLYRPGSELAAALQKHQIQAFDKLEKRGETQAFRDWLQQNAKSTDEVLIREFMGRYGNVWLIFDLDGVYVDYF